MLAIRRCHAAYFISSKRHFTRPSHLPRLSVAAFRHASSTQRWSTTSPSTENTTFSSTPKTRHAAAMEGVKQSEKVFYDDDQDEILVANADNLPMGSQEGFAVVHHFEYKEPTREEWESLGLPEKDLLRLNLRPENVTLPVALMMMDPSKYESISRARKFCRHGRIILHRGPLGTNEQGEAKVFIPENCKMGKVGDRVYPGDVIGRQVAVGDGYFSARQQKRAPPFSLPVVFEDDHFAIVDKPAGVVIYSHKNAGQALMTIKSALPHVLEPPKAGTISALRRPKAIHRLDRPTSGCLVIGKTLPAMDHLSAQFRDRVVKKTYTAVINGIPMENPAASISSREAFELGVDVDPESDHKWQLIDSPLEEKHAVTVWRAVRHVPSLRARDNCMTLVEVKPKTGRFHQIRRHMAWVCERPLVGDKDYDGAHPEAVKLRGRGLFLCSTSVTLEHPFYNTRPGREIWKNLEVGAKMFDGCQMWLDQENDKVMVRASVELPKKFDTFLQRSETVYNKYGPDDVENKENIDISNKLN